MSSDQGSTSGAAATPLEPREIDEVHSQSLALMKDTIALRRRLHQWPELGNDLPRTRDEVLASLEGLGLTTTLHETTSGIAALLEGNRPGPTVLLRGDMDALPLAEDTGLDFASRETGCMHACGHDTHTAMLVGAARILADRRGEIAGRVLFMFQPGEEGHHGARYMLDEGLLDPTPASWGEPSPIVSAFALHITSTLPSGWFGSRPGPVMASADSFSIEITGAGGHASEPHRARDPIPVACEIVQALQTMVTRQVDVFDPAVLTVARIDAGTTHNVIPETAEIEGTVRTVSEKTRAHVHATMRRVAEGVASAHGLTATVHLETGYPVTVNDRRHAEAMLDAAHRVVRPDARVITMPHPIMGAEDFSYVLSRVPGTMMFLGGTPNGADPARAAPNHSNRVMFDEDAMASGMAMYATVALERLR